MIGTMEVVVLGLLAMIAALAYLGRRLPIPYPILLVAGGVLLSLIPGLPVVHLTPELVFLIFLPPLLYPSAFFMPWRDFRANIRPILLLAIGLVLFTTIAVGFIAHSLIPELPLAAAIALGALVSPPDAVAATAVTEKLLVPQRIVTILQGESLVNDATALVAYRFASAAVVTGSVAWGVVSAQFVLVAVGGIAIGLIVGMASAWLQARVDDPPVEITMTLLMPYTAYLPAEWLGVSGVLAVVTSGLYMGWRLPEITSARTRLQAGPFWEMIEFLLNGFIFVLIGLQLPSVFKSLSGYSTWELVWYAGAVSLAVVLIRILWVFPAAYLPRYLFTGLRHRDPYPGWRNVTLVAWTGMRGVVSLAAALALPLTTQSGAPFPGRNLILFVTFSVILATLVGQGLTLPLLICWLGVKDDGLTQKEECEARLQANQAALERLHEVAESGSSKPDILQRLRVEYEERVQVLTEVCSRKLGRSPHALYSADYDQLARDALNVERATILRLRNERVINDEVHRHIQHDIDLAEARLGEREAA